MTEISADQRSAIKQRSTRMALTDNNLAAGMATAAGVVAFVSPPHATVLAIGSGLLWLCANYRQSIANDPPRDDFAEPWITSAVIDGASLPEEAREQRIFRFDAELLVVCDGLFALLRSIERFDGAVQAGDVDGANAQAEAARANAEVVASAQEILSELAVEVNEAWVSLSEELGLDWGSASLAEVQQVYLSNVGVDPEQPAPPLAAVAACVVDGAEDLLVPFDTGMSHPVLDADDLPSAPAPLISQEYLTDLAEMALELRALVVDT